jgi:transcriptional regulator with XRE-family HTH domain
MSTRTLLTTLGGRIRAGRSQAGLTQADLGSRAGIVGKYVSEIERGTRDIPLSTLAAVVERGLGMDLDIVFRPKGTGSRVSLPSAIDEVAELIAELPSEQQARILEIVRSILELARPSR